MDGISGHSATLAHQSVRAYYSAIAARIAVSLIATVVLALGVLAAGSSATRVRDVEAWARGVWHPPLGVTTRGYSHPLHVVKHLPPGMYRFSVLADEALGFHLVGPGVNRQTRVVWKQLEGFTPANARWRIRLRRGTYTYRAIGPDAGSVHPATGSFQIP